LGVYTYKIDMTTRARGMALGMEQRSREGEEVRRMMW
jgi:hypothetical protein